MHETALTWEDLGRPCCLFWVTVGGGNPREEVTTGAPEMDQTVALGKRADMKSLRYRKVSKRKERENIVLVLSLSVEIIFGFVLAGYLGHTYNNALCFQSAFPQEIIMNFSKYQCLNSQLCVSPEIPCVTGVVSACPLSRAAREQGSVRLNEYFRLMH